MLKGMMEASSPPRAGRDKNKIKDRGGARGSEGEVGNEKP